MSLVATADEEGGKKNCSAITPPPGHNKAVAENQSEVIVGAARGKGGKKKKSLKGGVTPSPMPPKGASKAAAAAGSKKLPAKPSAATQKTLALQAKWQAECEKLGGPNARIVVGRPEAKKKILGESIKSLSYITVIFLSCLQYLSVYFQTFDGFPCYSFRNAQR